MIKYTMKMPEADVLKRLDKMFPGGPSTYEEKKRANNILNVYGIDYEKYYGKITNKIGQEA